MDDTVTDGGHPDVIPVAADPLDDQAGRSGLIRGLDRYVLGPIARDILHDQPGVALPDALDAAREEALGGTSRREHREFEARRPTIDRQDPIPRRLFNPMRIAGSTVASLIALAVHASLSLEMIVTASWPL
jgi:hypothetical protein